MIPSDFALQTDQLIHKTLLITGAAHGIGRAVSLACAKQGATVILLDKDIPATEKLYDAIVESGAPQPAIYPMDLNGATLDDYATLEETLTKNFGKLDGLIQNAANLGQLGPISQYDLQRWQEVMMVNFNAPLLLTRACLSLLKAADKASLLFTSDQVGRKAKAYWGAYGISKFALEGLMQTLAEELETNTAIRVNSLDPGPARTMLRSAAYPGEEPHSIPSPESVALPFVYLMSDQSQHLHGHRLTGQDMI